MELTVLLLEISDMNRRRDQFKDKERSAIEAFIRVLMPLDLILGESIIHLVSCDKRKTTLSEKVPSWLFLFALTAAFTLMEGLGGFDEMAIYADIRVPVALLIILGFSTLVLVRRLRKSVSRQPPHPVWCPLLAGAVEIALGVLVAYAWYFLAMTLGDALGFWYFSGL